MSQRYAFSLLACLFALPAFADDWPQWLGPTRDGVWRETGLVDKFPEGGPKESWRIKIGQGYSGPAIAFGKVYVTDRILDPDAKNPDSAFDKKTRVNGVERMLCVDESTGTIIWKHEYKVTYQISYASGPRTTPVVSGGKVYAVGAMGDLYCYDADKGEVLWSKKLLDEYKMQIPIWGFAGHPLVDGNRLICLVGGKGSVVVAFDKDTGKELWKNLTASEPGYCPPMIYTIAGKPNLIIWHPESVNSLNPETGESYWSFPFSGKGKKNGIKAGLTIPTPRLDGDNLFLTAFYDGPLMLKVGGSSPTQIWRGQGRGEKPEQTDGLHSIMTTPILKDGYIYGVCSYGELRCLEAATGKRLWETRKPTRKLSAAESGEPDRWGHAFIVPQGDRYVLFNEHGDLILANMSPKGYEEISRARILTPTNRMPGRPVIWSHPAFANRCVVARSDSELVRVSLAK